MSLKISKNWSVELNENLLDVYFRPINENTNQFIEPNFFLD